MIPAKNTASTLSPATCDAAAATAAAATTAAAPSNPKLYKCEDIPLTISASLAKQSSLMRTRAKKTNHDIIDDYGIKASDQHHQDSNESNDDDEIDYTYTSATANANPYIHYSTMNTNGGGDYLRKTTAHLHRNVNNNSTIASTNRYRWHNQSDEIALQSMRNNSMTIAPTTKPNAMTMHSNHRAHSSSNRKQHHLNQINNNFIVTNKKQPVNAHHTFNDQNSIDQNNGNYYPSRLYH